MATRSTIAVQHPDGKVTQIYAHWDGYPSWNGRLLFVYYSDYLKAKELVSLGDLSKLAQKIYPTSPNHTFDTPQPEVCVYYGRDRGEEGVYPKIFQNLDQYVQDAPFEEYNYILINGVWYVNDVEDEERVFMPLIDVLDQESSENLDQIYHVARSHYSPPVLPNFSSELLRLK